MAEMVETMAEKLMEGKERAIQLQSILLNPLYFTDEALQASAKQLTFKILGSYNQTLSIAAVKDQLLASDLREEELRKKKWPPAAAVVKNRRGCYKRKRTSDSLVVTSSTMEDGCGWRKYGQKHIFNSKYPRCTYKSQGCRALKQVQKLKEDPLLYQITYFNHHKCSNHSIILPLSFPAEESKNILNFQSNRTNANATKKHDRDKYYSNQIIINDISSDPIVNTIDFESKEGVQSRLDLPFGAATTSTKPPSSWDSIMGPCGGEAVSRWSNGILMCNAQDDDQAANSGLSPWAWTSFQELEFMEVNQFGDINFDEVYGSMELKMIRPSSDVFY